MGARGGSLSRLWVEQRSAVDSDLPDSNRLGHLILRLVHSAHALEIFCADEAQAGHLTRDFFIVRNRNAHVDAASSGGALAEAVRVEDVELAIAALEKRTFRLAELAANFFNLDASARFTLAVEAEAVGEDRPD